MKSIKPNKLYWASFNNFEFRIIGQAIIDICHSGPCDSDVAKWRDEIKLQIEKDKFRNAPTFEKIKEELRNWGAWDENELGNTSDNFDRIIWIAAWNIFEDRG